MTLRKFDAPASTTRPASSTQDRGRRPIVRIAWLVARFLRREAVRYDDYEERFGRSVRSFHRDIAALREAGIYLDNDLQGEYRMLCFRSNREAA
jgi:predicted DNA-binding transcriptional regulator YafY